MYDGLASLCPACGGEACVMGALGNRMHYRCNHCGGQFSEVVDETNTCRNCGDTPDQLELGDDEA